MFETIKQDGNYRDDIRLDTDEELKYALEDVVRDRKIPAAIWLVGEGFVGAAAYMESRAEGRMGRAVSLGLGALGLGVIGLSGWFESLRRSSEMDIRDERRERELVRARERGEIYYLYGDDSFVAEKETGIIILLGGKPINGTEVVSHKLGGHSLVRGNTYYPVTEVVGMRNVERARKAIKKRMEATDRDMSRFGGWG